MLHTQYLVPVFALLLPMAACTLQSPHPDTPGTHLQLHAQPWPEADRLFFNNPNTPQFKGADVANSVALDGNRILWVFGDTLLSEPGVNSCDRFNQFNIPVHNSLAIQTGSNPATAQIAHFWGVRGGEPAAFFSPPEEDGSWYWMGGVTVINQQALVFLMHARATDNAAPTTGDITACAGLDFEMLGWEARIANISAQPPDQWDWHAVKLPDDTHWHSILTGSSTPYVQYDYLYAWSAGPSVFNVNPVYLARWPLAAAQAADLSEPQWHTGAGWKTQTALADKLPTAIVAEGNNEVSVSNQLWPQEDARWWWLQSSHVLNSPLCYRSSDSPFGFGECHELMSPPELKKYPHSSLLVYAVKFHPALTDSDDNTAIASYVVNSCNLKDIQHKCDLYYPRFIKLCLGSARGCQKSPHALH